MSTPNPPGNVFPIHSELDSLALVHLFNELENQPIVMLKINNSTFDNAATDALIALLNHTTRLQKLVFKSINISPNNLQKIANYLAQNPPLRFLTIKSSALDNAVAEIFADALKSNTHLEKFSFSGNRIDDEGATQLFNTLMDDNHTLRQLRLDRNNVSLWMMQMIKNQLIANTERPRAPHHSMDPYILR